MEIMEIMAQADFNRMIEENIAEQALLDEEAERMWGDIQNCEYDAWMY